MLILSSLWIATQLNSLFASLVSKFEILAQSATSSSYSHESAALVKSSSKFSIWFRQLSIWKRKQRNSQASRSNKSVVDFFKVERLFNRVWLGHLISWLCNDPMGHDDLTHRIGIRLKGDICCFRNVDLDFFLQGRSIEFGLAFSHLGLGRDLFSEKLNLQNLRPKR